MIIYEDPRFTTETPVDGCIAIMAQNANNKITSRTKMIKSYDKVMNL